MWNDLKKCAVKMPTIRFKSGRKDCEPLSPEEPYIASKKEVHPSAHFNGPELLDWFAEYFGLKGDYAHGGHTDLVLFL